MRLYELGACAKTDLKAYLIWIHKNRERVLVAPVAIRAGDVLSLWVSTI
jgi:REP element-mobilizing transposase RayT